ncbi:MAG: membrane dipeptidase [Gemmatimonadota bacterium]|nr:membrane dipeptidase [Gemmatimonadota bacterium]
MKRRDFVKGMAMAGAASGLTGAAAGLTGVAAQASPGRATGQDVASPDAPSFSPLTQDDIVVDGLFAGAMRLSHLREMQEGGAHCGVAGGPSDMASYAALLRFFDEYADEVVLAKSVAEIRDAHARGLISNVFCWQSATVLGDSFNSPLGSAATSLRAFYEVGLRQIGLCYNVANAFGSGCLEPEGPLTRAGHRLVEEMHSLGIILDVGGHTGERTTLDAIAISDGVPVICSHTNIAAIADNYRCISDRVIDAIAGTGGVIGITAVNDFHVRGRGNTGPTPHVGIEEHVDQYDYIKNRVGVDHVGMGTDFVGGMEIPYGGGINAEIITTDMVSEPWRFIRGFESIAELPNVIDGLRRRGWTDDEVAKAMGANWLRVYQQVWGG